MKYETATPIGRGGMGEVFKAYDPVLGRHVALKYLRWTEPALVERFLREARLQARVDHELVCRVYDVGIDQGRPYIAMEYVDGLTLEEAAGEMSLADKVGVVRDVAHAVHAAHQTGLIHRDLKPQNVLVERSGNSWKPHVVDFGLAREPAASGTTETGQLLGTPEYMSPEQARGDVHRLDRRTDVYSLGAVLYRLLVGRPPFVGGDLEVAMKVAYADPEPARRVIPTLPVDLDTIVMKCLEKEPLRRYDSALALAEDLQRFSRGDLILARPATWGERARRFASRNKVLVGVIGGAVLFSVLAFASAWQERRDAQARALASQRFGAEAEGFQGFLRQAQMLPLHDTRPERAIVRERMKALEIQIQEMGSVALGPGSYALGQGYFALGEDEKARTALEAAWRQDYRTPGVAFALGRVLGQLYRTALDDAGGISNAALRLARVHEAEQSLRDPALSYLKAGGSDPAQPRAFVEGLVAFNERRYEAAVERARAASAQAPWFYEAKLLEADADLAAASEAAERGEYDAALAGSARAGAACQELIGMARSFPRAYEMQCQRLMREHEIQMRRGRDSLEMFERAAAACADALKANPDNGDTYSVLARLHWRRGEALADRGVDSRPLVEQAIALAEEGTRRSPESFRPWGDLGSALWSVAELESTRGGDPLPHFQRAVESFDRVLRLRPGYAPVLGNVGALLYERGKYEMDHGLDPEASLAESIRAFENGIAIAPEVPQLHGNLGNAHFHRAQHAMSHGGDPRPSLALAVKAYQAALRLNPNNVYAYSNYGDAQRMLASYLDVIGLDPEPPVTEALESLKRATQLNPRFPYAYKNLSDVHLTRAVHVLGSGGDPRQALGEARKALASAFSVRSRYAEAYMTLAGIEAAEAEFSLRSDTSPGRALARGRAATRRALELGPDADVALVEGRLWLLEARALMRARRTPTASLVRARESLSRARAKAPGNPAVLVAAAELCRWESEAALARGDRATAQTRVVEGLAAVTQVLAAGPSLVRARALKDELEQLRR